MTDGVEGGRVLGTGVDLVENQRVRALLTRWGPRFRDRVYLPAEQAYCESKAAPWLYYAGRFAVKEAVPKPLERALAKDSAGWTSRSSKIRILARLRPDWARWARNWPASAAYRVC